MMKKLLLCYNKFLIAGIFLFSVQLILAQQLSEEPVGGMDAEETPANLPPSNSVLPAELNFAPLNQFYSSWDTLYVRRYSEPLPSITDSIYLPLIPEGTSNFVFPKNGQLLSPFGYRGRRVHAGVDLKLNLHDTVVAAFDGVVRMARYYAGYGNCVVIRHYNGLETLYGHLSKIKVKINQNVKAGDLVGLGGSTGRASCNHLHFETRFRGQAFNPKQLIDFENYKLIKDTLVITGKTFGRSRDYMPGMVASTSVDDNKTTVSKSKGSKGSKKYHTIKSGDTLYALSRKYGTSVKQICALNSIKPTKVLKLGSKIRVR